MTRIETRIEARKFMGIVLENIAGSADMVTDKMIDSINRWLNQGNKKEDYFACEVDVLVDWVMTGK